MILIIKAYNEATTILEITNRYATSQISEFSRFIKFLSKRQPIPEGWWDKQKRAELTGIAGRGASSQIAINDLRLKLIAKFLSIKQPVENLQKLSGKVFYMVGVGGVDFSPSGGNCDQKFHHGI